ADQAGAARLRRNRVELSLFRQRAQLFVDATLRGEDAETEHQAELREPSAQDGERRAATNATDARVLSFEGEGKTIGDERAVRHDDRRARDRRGDARLVRGD